MRDGLNIKYKQKRKSKQTANNKRKLYMNFIKITVSKNTALKEELHKEENVAD